ncbi:MAG: dipicolinate synthase subunit A [Ruminococcus sp.]|nr:dipicolinate synthase subunit A [Ruminococcus sp.]
MKSKEKILIAGGDLRQLYCCARLSELYDTSIYGFDQKALPRGLNVKTAELSALGNEPLWDYLVLPVKPCNQDLTLYAPFSEATPVPLCDILNCVKEDGAVFEGKSTGDIKKQYPLISFESYLEREDFQLLNAVPSAEGAVFTAMKELDVTLSSLPVLVVGMGRTGTALVNILKGFGADITVAVRSAEGSAKAKIAGVKSCCISDIDGRFPLVFNTAPALVFDYELLKKFTSDTLFIDLASAPGGIDFDYAHKLGLKTIHALGLPGKKSPVTAGEIIAETVMHIIAERSDQRYGKLIPKA